MSLVLRSSRSKMGAVVRIYEDTESGLFTARATDGRVLAIDYDSELAFLRGWSLLLNVRPFSVVRNHFGRFRKVVLSAVPMDSAVVSIRYPSWGSAAIKFHPARPFFAPCALAA